MTDENVERVHFPQQVCPRDPVSPTRFGRLGLLAPGGTVGRVRFYHYDLYGQALAKIERGHTQDVIDVRHMLESGLVEPSELRRLFTAIESDLERYPAIDPSEFRRKLDATLGGAR